MTPEEILISLAYMAPAFTKQLSMLLVYDNMCPGNRHSDTNPRTGSFISTEVTDQFISSLPRKTQEGK